MRWLAWFAFANGLGMTVAATSYLRYIPFPQTLITAKRFLRRSGIDVERAAVPEIRVEGVLRFPGRGSPAAALAISAFVVVCAVVGCTETQVLSRRGRFQPEPLPRPNRIVVYDFDTTHAEVKLDPSIAKEIARGRTPIGEARRQVALAVADVLAAALVDEILALGMPAERGKGAPVPKQGALIVDGQIGRIDEGSRAVRAAVGYGAGQSELRTLVHVYHVTERGRRRIGEFATVTQTPETVNAGGVTNGGAAKQTSDKTNVVVDAERTAKKAGDVLAELFVRQGWMSDGVR